MKYDVKVNDLLSTNILIIFGCELEFNLLEGFFTSLDNLQYRINGNHYYSHILSFDNEWEKTLEISTGKFRNTIDDLREFREVCDRLKSLNPIYLLTEGTHFHFDSSIIHIMNYDIEHSKFIDYYYKNLTKIKEEDNDSLLYFLKFRISIENIINKLSLFRQDTVKMYMYDYSRDIYDIVKPMIDVKTKPEYLLKLDKTYALNLNNYTNQLIHKKSVRDTLEERRGNPTCNYEELYIYLNFLIRVYLFGSNRDNRQIIDAIYENGLLDPNMDNLNSILDFVFDNEQDKINTRWLFNEEIDYSKTLKYK